ncbi:MAG: hypothetical protein DI533_03010 [Cereibacter sphaeroides]|uniref:DUF4279 domain-containing protein n=1 Tax=Cereibacter sphaeroides TaxID=1063 RepID=A0A2W5SCN8_CERSP|nr:MAG: hypothetical protein DI533_03010 [Cereibacter sphaeroides]
MSFETKRESPYSVVCSSASTDFRGLSDICGARATRLVVVGEVVRPGAAPAKFSVWRHTIELDGHPDRDAAAYLNRALELLEIVAPRLQPGDDLVLEIDCDRFLSGESVGLAPDIMRRLAKLNARLDLLF